jgi:ribosomal protein L16 Arg81 hydroxylase
VQCEGKTNFKVWKEVEDHTDEKQVKLDMKEEPILDVIMEPGDAIWIPRYYPHHAISLTPRLSVSFPFADDENSTLKKHFEDRNWITL